MILVLKCINLKYNTSKVAPIERHAQPLSATRILPIYGVGVANLDMFPHLDRLPPRLNLFYWSKWAYNQKFSLLYNFCRQTCKSDLTNSFNHENCESIKLIKQTLIKQTLINLQYNQYIENKYNIYIIPRTLLQ